MENEGVDTLSVSISHQSSRLLSLSCNRRIKVYTQSLLNAERYNLSLTMRND